MRKTGSKPRKRRDSNIYPPGWDLQKTREVAAYYDARKDQPVLDEDSAQIGSVWMEIPNELVAEVRKLISRRRKSA